MVLNDDENKKLACDYLRAMIVAIESNRATISAMTFEKETCRGIFDGAGMVELTPSAETLVRLSVSGPPLRRGEVTQAAGWANQKPE